MNKQISVLAMILFLSLLPIPRAYAAPDSADAVASADTKPSSPDKEAPRKESGEYDRSEEVEWANFIEDENSGGMHYTYYEGGQRKTEGVFKGGKPEGLHKEYYENGQLKKEKNLKDGKLDGLCRGYYESGQLAYDGTYKEDQLEGASASYYKNGKLKSETIWKNGKRDWIGKEYYENGQMSFSDSYTKGRLDWVREYYENGQLKSERIFKHEDGMKLAAPVKEYDEKGNLKR